MIRVCDKKMKNPRRLQSFKEELIQAYRKFKTELESVCERHGAEINYWYTPSDVPQPKFILDRVSFDADQLLAETKLVTEPKKRKDRKASRRRKSYARVGKRKV